MIVAPTKPFDTYKWRWLSVQPTESLLKPEIFLGVLRALGKHSGSAPSSEPLRAELAKVEIETHSPVTLARDPERNLIRNSGQYWKGTGLLNEASGQIQLTPLGIQVASGQVTQGEFAALMVQQTELPNSFTYAPAEVAKWATAGLKIRPLALILQILETLSEKYGRPSAWLTKHELVRIVVPLSGDKRDKVEIAAAINEFRNDLLDVSSWPDCAPGANDERLAREFLLFLTNYGLCSLDNSSGEERFYLAEQFDVKTIIAPPVHSMFNPSTTTAALIQEVRHSELPSIVERQRVMISVISRPQQSLFRTTVMKACGGQCVITGESITEVLEAAHIIPVGASGADTVENGLCLRIDIHRLFDSGNLKIAANGVLKFTDAVVASRHYKLLPSTIAIPTHVTPKNLEWREKYW